MTTEKQLENNRKALNKIVENHGNVSRAILSGSMRIRREGG